MIVQVDCSAGPESLYDVKFHQSELIKMNISLEFINKEVKGEINSVMKFT